MEADVRIVGGGYTGLNRQCNPVGEDSDRWTINVSATRMPRSVGSTVKRHLATIDAFSRATTAAPGKSLHC